ncbi:MAG: YdcF family protein [Acidobacteriaceae bacterium]|nr:YdcF family protein [Acidobacteriaceae bacterium]
MSPWRKLCVGLSRVTAIAVILLAVLCLTSGSFLIINQPRHADVIVVLAGEEDLRPALGLELLNQNFAPRLLLDVSVDGTIYGRSSLELAREYLQSQPHVGEATTCSINGLSTKAETEDVKRCLEPLKVHTVLLVTSEYHTRRALSIFRKMCPQYEFSVAAAFDNRQFGTRWWRRRQWAKMNLGEWLRLLWWEAVDRWHGEARGSIVASAKLIDAAALEG